MKFKEQIKVLLVEDDKILQLMGKKTLDNMNCAVDIASNGKEAVNKFRAKEYDLILMDLGLPDWEGRVTAGKIRKIENNRHTTKAIPIIAYTARGKDEELSCIQAGMNSFLEKPASQEELYNSIQQLIRG